MSNQEQKLDTCGCCEGVKAPTPVLIKNLPGLSVLAYRVGTHAGFKVTMQSALSGQPRLRQLTTRDDDDPAIALCDAWATVLDVLSFYQERIANEGYLRTATERRSILEMARSIGYELRPGVAAGTYQAFTLETAKGSPTTAKIGVGTKAQSVPAQDESPQVFETAEEIEARAEWNQLKPLLKRKEIPGFGSKEIHLKGITTGLKPGDGLLMIGAERETEHGSERWDFRRIKGVTIEPDADSTRVTWDKGLGWQMFSKKVLPAERDFQLFALRQRAFLFGHNAPDWRILPDEVRARYLNGNEGDSKADKNEEWSNLDIASISGTPDSEEIKTIYLDALYPQIVEGSWLVLVTPEPKFYVEVYKVLGAVESSRKDFTLTSKTTAVTLEGEHLRPKFNDRVRETVVYAQSETIEIAEAPITEPISGSEIVLDSLVEGLEEGRKLIITGKRIRARIGQIDDATSVKKLKPGDELVVMEPPTEVEENPDEKTWHLKGNLEVDGKNMELEGYVTVPNGRIIFTSAKEEDETVSELIELSSLEAEDDSHTKLVLADSLQNIYDRATVKILANVARATHGGTKKEVLGSGDGSQTFQKFELKQKPLTHISAPTSTGTKSTLEIRVNDLLWEEVPAFDRVPPDKRAYITRIADDGKVTVQFGDGINGARVPTGVENIVATYRIGTGLEGMVKAGQISTLMTRPLGVREVNNPLPSTGADNPEKLDRARRNAPLTVLTFDRIVSLSDFEDFVSAFTGIGKAQATIVWDGEQRLVHITVAGADGGPVEATSDLYKNLVDGIDAARHPHHRVKVDSYKRLTFNVKAKVRVDSSYIVEDVLASVKATLIKAFSFEERSFGQAVTASQVQAIIQKVKGVIALDLDHLYLTSQEAHRHTRLPENMADWEVSLNNPARLLIVNPQGITLTEMTI